MEPTEAQQVQDVVTQALADAGYGCVASPVITSTGEQVSIGVTHPDRPDVAVSMTIAETE